MKYNDAEEFIQKCNRAGIVPGLDSIKRLCEKLGNPQDELKFIHIAGTNGKGSTLAYISTILKVAGYKVGRYISPTICTYLERFQVNEKPMSKAAFGRYAESVRNACDEIVSEGNPHPTAFEVETAIAFLYFLDKKCDVVVLECGMGGLEDATNLITTTILEVFAHIDMDHMQFLGESLEDIARQKAGIIKKNSYVVSAYQYDEVRTVIEETARLVSAKNDDDRCDGICTYFIEQDSITDKKYSLGGQSFKYNGRSYKTPLLGTCQVDNAALAVLAIKALNKQFETNNAKVAFMHNVIDDGCINKGLAATVWPARLQKISSKPLFYIDGAHNPDAAGRLKESVELYFSDKRKIYIMGMFRDKAVEEVVAMMAPDADMVLTVATPNNPRALSSVELGRIVAKYNDRVTTLDSVEEAVEMSKLLADKNTVVLAFGSLSYLGRLIELFDR